MTIKRSEEASEIIKYDRLRLILDLLIEYKTEVRIKISQAYNPRYPKEFYRFKTSPNDRMDYKAGDIVKGRVTNYYWIDREPDSWKLFKNNSHKFWYKGQSLLSEIGNGGVVYLDDNDKDIMTTCYNPYSKNRNKYDKDYNNNWVSRIVYKDDDIETAFSLFIREIEYYE